MQPVVRTIRAVQAAVLATPAQISPRRLIVTAAAIVTLVAVVAVVPLPTAVQLRDWATSLGSWFPVAFLAAHIVVTVFPFPRTAFTLAAGLLFGPALGVSIAVAASTVSAVIALLLVRALGLQLRRLEHHPGVAAVNTHLRRRGWAAILSMRLIPAVPFSVLNYAAGVSAVRTLPYTVATLAGLLPGTAAVVVLGDALTGEVSPLLLAVSAGTAVVGIAGLVHEVRRHRRAVGARAEAAEPVAVR
ncbi:TVP38/TMEM64 family protein [uncultured Mycolicibacterium sp.]|uniref:TVP38/TMEM64 family protein n=1 Tax=uncultured Mycolicibacterium sp. TaxID=2320817 RepID=UPI0026350778|nr:TVP38/TMEM64 family protein [uncultured Mycolicibacterium sp.]